MARRIKSFEEYKEWWRREARLGRRMLPYLKDMPDRYLRYLDNAPAYLADEVNYARQQFELEQRTQVQNQAYPWHRYGISRSPNLDWRNHPFECDAFRDSRDRELTHTSIVNGDHQPDGFAYKEAINMNACIVKVYFGSNDLQVYSYLAVKGFSKENSPYVVVPRSNAIGEIKSVEQMSIGTVHEVIDIIDDIYDGELKWIVDTLDTADYNKRLTVEAKRNKIIKQIEAMAEKKNTLDKLRKLTEGDEEAAKLFAQLEELDK